MAKVLLKFKGMIIKEIPVTKGLLTIGRTPECDIHIDNPAVSGFHAKIVKDGPRFLIEDTNSTNGTFLNGKRIFKSSLIKGDEISIGKHTLSLLLEGDDTVEEKVPGGKHMLDRTVALDIREQNKLLGKKPGGEGEE